MALDMKELKQMAAGDLADKEKQLVQELFALRFQFGSGRLENPMQIRKTKRDIARVKTVLRQLQDRTTEPKA